MSRQASSMKNHTHHYLFFNSFLIILRINSTEGNWHLLANRKFQIHFLVAREESSCYKKFICSFKKNYLYKYLKIFKLCKSVASNSLHFRACRVFWHCEREPQPFSTNEGVDIAETVYQGMRNIPQTHHILWEKNHVSWFSRKPVLSRLSPGIFNNSP